jgi:hypothetical protein
MEMNKKDFEFISSEFDISHDAFDKWKHSISYYTDNSMNWFCEVYDFISSRKFEKFFFGETGEDDARRWAWDIANKLRYRPNEV